MPNSNPKEKHKTFPFYPEAWMGGTMGMSLKEKGAYMELLILQFNIGSFSLNQAKYMLGVDFETLWEVLKRKFKEEGNTYHNVRLHAEISKYKTKHTLTSPNENTILFTKCKYLYWQWHIDKVGFKPQMDGSDLKGLKLIIGFFYSIEDSYDNIYQNFESVLLKYDSWDRFDKNNTRLRQINSRLTNIINYLKNGQKGNRVTSSGLSQQFKKDITIPDLSSSSGG